jgi:hypothetical protein
MSADKKVHEGKVVGSDKGPSPLRSLDAFNAVGQIVDAARECFVIHEQESSRRARLRAYEATEVAKIKAAEAVLKHYFDQVFTERRGVYEEMFTRLDRAMDQDDAAAVHAVLRGIVDIAQSSPLADLGDLGQIRKALDDPNQVWDL